jgi:hypothetical protein
MSWEARDGRVVKRCHREMGSPEMGLKEFARRAVKSRLRGECSSEREPLWKKAERWLHRKGIRG